MSGRERTGADFYPPGGGGAFRSPFRSPGRPGGAPCAQKPGRQRGKILTFFDPFCSAPKGRPEGVSAHPLTGTDFYPPPGGPLTFPLTLLLSLQAVMTCMVAWQEALLTPKMRQRGAPWPPKLTGFLYFYN